VPLEETMFKGRRSTRASVSVGSRVLLVVAVLVWPTGTAHGASDFHDSILLSSWVPLAAAGDSLDESADVVTSAWSRWLAVFLLAGALLWRLSAASAMEPGRTPAAALFADEFLAGALADGVLVLDDTGRIVWANAAAANMLDYSASDLIGRSHHSRIHHSRSDGAPVAEEECTLIKALQEQRPIVLAEDWFWRHDGTGLPVEYSCTPLRLEGERPLAAFVFRDVTSRRQSEDTAAHLGAEYRALFEQSRDAVYISTADGAITDANQAALDLLGYSRDELRAIRAVDLYVDTADRQRFREVIEQQNSVKDFRAGLRRKDGTEITCLFTSTARRDPGGNLVGYQGIIRDITDSLRMQAENARLQGQLAHAQRMEAVGALASGVAHDFNNVLTAIFGYIGLAKGTLPPSTQRLSR
jgi:PAS domain S-box-containing protein